MCERIFYTLETYCEIKKREMSLLQNYLTLFELEESSLETKKEEEKILDTILSTKNELSLLYEQGTPFVAYEYY